MVFVKLLCNVWIHERRGKRSNELYGGSYYGGNGRTGEVHAVDLQKNQVLVSINIDLGRHGWAWVESRYVELPADTAIESIAQTIDRESQRDG